jgi:myosin heavy subunit
MDSINMADPHFVRCVNPNAEKKAYVFHDQKAIEQLRCGGVIEAVRMARESYPTRMLHAEFVGSFSVVCPGLQRSSDARATCLAIVKAQQIPDKQYRLGSTMILLKREAVDKMEKERGRLLAGRAIVVQVCSRTRLQTCFRVFRILVTWCLNSECCSTPVGRS